MKKQYLIGLLGLAIVSMPLTSGLLNINNNVSTTIESETEETTGITIDDSSRIFFTDENTDENTDGKVNEGDTLNSIMITANCNIENRSPDIKILGDSFLHFYDDTAKNPLIDIQYYVLQNEQNISYSGGQVIFEDKKWINEVNEGYNDINRYDASFPNNERPAYEWTFNASLDSINDKKKNQNNLLSNVDKSIWGYEAKEDDPELTITSDIYGENKSSSIPGWADKGVLEIGTVQSEIGSTLDVPKINRPDDVDVDETNGILELEGTINQKNADIKEIKILDDKNNDITTKSTIKSVSDPHGVVSYDVWTDEYVAAETKSSSNEDGLPNIEGYQLEVEYLTSKQEAKTITKNSSDLKNTSMIEPEDLSFLINNHNNIVEIMIVIEIILTIFIVLSFIFILLVYLWNKNKIKRMKLKKA